MLEVPSDTMEKSKVFTKVNKLEKEYRLHKENKDIITREKTIREMKKLFEKVT